MSLLSVSLLLAVPAALSGDETPAFTEAGYTVQPPPLVELEVLTGTNDQLRAHWRGRWGEHEVDVSLFRIPSEQFGLASPEDVLDLVQSNVQQGGRPFFFEHVEVRDGAYGYAPYASVGWGDVRTAEGERYSTLLSFTSLLDGSAYSLEASCTPAVDESIATDIVDWLEKAVSFDGPEWNYKWSDEEAEQRWAEAMPSIPLKDLEVVRSKHYIIITNSSGKKLFSKKMEECYKEIRKLFPFPEAKKRRLMPVFLLRTPQQYHEFCQTVAGMSAEKARNTAGHAWRDYYATWYEAPNDPVHIHEATHQIFGNRLRLGGAGSWFQEGVAEYVETRKNQRNDAARMVKKERHRRIPDFVRVPSLIGESGDQDIKGGSEAGNLYKQAALFIEFLRESKFGKKKFDEFLHSVGRVRRNDTAAIAEVVMRVYEVDLERLDELFVEYCKKR